MDFRDLRVPFFGVPKIAIEVTHPSPAAPAPARLRPTEPARRSPLVPGLGVPEALAGEGHAPRVLRLVALKHPEVLLPKKIGRLKANHLTFGFPVVVALQGLRKKEGVKILGPCNLRPLGEGETSLG